MPVLDSILEAMLAEQGEVINIYPLQWGKHICNVALTPVTCVLVEYVVDKLWYVGSNMVKK